MAIDISQFSEMFFDETEELLADLERLLLTVNIDEPDLEDINAIFRIAHSIKGGGCNLWIFRFNRYHSCFRIYVG